MNGDKIMEALGYVECDGLTSATVAADRMLKTSDVQLSRIRNAENGWITLEFTGDIAALEVAVETVKQTLPEKYVAGLVIGSPAKGLDEIGSSGATDVNPPNFNPEKYNSDGSMKESAMFGPRPKTVTKAPQLIKTDSVSTSQDQPTEKPVDAEVTCNLCGDPECPRKMGEPHVKCIHYSELKNKDDANKKKSTNNKEE